MPRILILALLLVALPVRSASAAAAAEIPARDVDLEVVAQDGVLLRGIVAIPDPGNDPGGPRRWPVAILVPPQLRPRSTLVPLSDALARAGIASVLLDLRGQGDSMTTRNREIYSAPMLPPSYLRLAASDQARVLEALAKFPELDLSRVALVGVAHGALVAAAAAAGLPQARALVLVDAPESQGGFSTERDLGLFDARPALLLCSGFPVSRARAEALSEFGLGERTVRCVGEFFNGTALLAENGAGTAAVASWLTTVLDPAPPAAPRDAAGSSPLEGR